MSASGSLGLYSEACRDAHELLELSADATQRIIDAPPFGGRGFTPIGAVALGSEDMLIYAGLKTRASDARKRVAEEMLVGDILLKHKPALVNALPTFTLPAETADGESLGILTEDFTRDGVLKLVERRLTFHPTRVNDEGPRKEYSKVPEGLHTDVYEALGDKVYAEAFGHMTGWVGHHEVMIDFNDITYPSDKKLEPYEELARELTVTVGA